MSPDQFNAYIKDRYQAQLSYFDQRANRSKRKYVMFQSGAIIFAVAAPILVVAMPEALKFITASVSAMAAFFTTSLKTFRFHDHWMSARATHDALEREHYFRIAGLDVYREAQDPQSLFVERVEAALARESGDWLIGEKTAADQPAPKTQPTNPQGKQQDRSAEKRSAENNASHSPANHAPAAEGSV